MTSAVFFHNFNEVNWKLWTLACMSAAVAGTFTAISSQPNTANILNTLTIQGKQAENIGQYRQARQDYDLALLRARAGRDKEALFTALMNSARIDGEFDEEKLATMLASEAVELSSKLHGNRDLRSAEAMALMADLVGDNGQSLALYKKALAILKEKLGDKDARVARVLMEMSYCYEQNAERARAISACKAALRIYEQLGNTVNSDFAKALVEYASICDLEQSEKTALFQKALRIQEKALGKSHPSLSVTLQLVAADETEFKKKEALLQRALQIDESIFGKDSVRTAQDLAALADSYQSAGKRKEARELRERARAICSGKSNTLDCMSTDFLVSYSKLLHDLKFDKEAARIDTIVQSKQSNSPSKASSQIAEDLADAEMDPEYWERTELVPIDNVHKFSCPSYDHIQLWYEKGSLKLDTFKEGDLVWSKQLGDCPTGILNASANGDLLTVSWRDGDGPVWHNDKYKIAGNSAIIESSSTVDAYAEQMNKQVDEVLNGDADAVNDGSVESVPGTYINNNFIADTIRKGQRKALQLYGLDDPAAAAERLATIFDLSAKAINTQRIEINPALNRYDQWLDAWQYQQLPQADYITALNDYGFFLQRSGCLKQSVEVLCLVTSVSQDRAVAHLNLADSYWKLGKQNEAQISYQNYLHLMGSEDRKRIPSRVFQRLTSVHPRIQRGISSYNVHFGV